MKKVFIMVVSFLATSTLYCQCTITGNSSLITNQTSTFTIDKKAQCVECYSWKSSDEKNIVIEGNKKGNSIIVNGKNPGLSNISVSVFTENGIEKCEKTVNVSDNNVMKQNNIVDNSCGIRIDDFKGVKVSESVISFFPNVNSEDYFYKWTVSYSNGQSNESTEKIPQFNLSASGYITSVKLKVTNKTQFCSIAILKKFDENYWKSSRVEQKIYSPISYSDYVKKNESVNEERK